MPERPLYLAFYWHMHQPFYKDHVEGHYTLPWVRLHGIKDYCDMVLLLEDFPTLHQTFNLVPSLIQQIKDYVENGATDRFLDLTLRPASDLSPPEKITLLKNFFMANWEQMIAPYPRYLELLLKRGYQATGHDLERAAFYFTEQDFLDLQICFNLAWFDPLFKESDPLLIELVRKGKDYTEEEKGLVIEKQREILGRIIPTYQRLAATGRIELTTTPYYHPILPLLCDTDLARMAVPEVALPKKRFQHPEDARHQIERAVAYHREVFGMTPRGMWPSEGSVSEEVIPLVADAGIQWLATDEGVLRESYRRSGLEFDKVIGAQYLPYRVSKEGREVTLFFRDRFLSDRIGFVYSKWDPQKAAEDFIHHLREIQKVGQKSQRALLVSVILDGENAWEFYRNDGRDFFYALYERIAKDPMIRTVTLSEYLANHPAEETLPRLHAGSWINHNFMIWIGQEEDNLAWDLLSETREMLCEAGSHGKPEEREKLVRAWEEIYIAEGSDWCWWYGGEHFGMVEEFDELFRNHLMNVYRILGREVPDHLKIPILRKGKQAKATLEQVGLIRPTVDGHVTSYFEWLSAGFYDTTKTGAAMHQVHYLVSRIYYGCDLERLYLRFDFSPPSNEVRSRDYVLLVHFLEPSPRRLHLRLSPEGTRPMAILFQNNEDREWIKVEEQPEAAMAEILELSLRLAALGAQGDQEVRFFVTVSQPEGEDREIERWPSRGYISQVIPTADFDALRWSV